MATPGELIEATAVALGVPEPTVFQYDRTLAEHGLRSKRGRGRSAPKVTARDAANLLIAAVATPVSGWSTKHAARACQYYACLAMVAGPADKRERPDWLMRLNLPRRHSFGEALAALIENSGRFEDFAASKAKALPARLRVSLEGPRRRAEIVSSIRSDDPYKDELRKTRTVIYQERKGSGRAVEQRHTASGDLTLRASITLNTIHQLGSLLKDERHD